jgi:hypothetical protein
MTFISILVKVTLVLGAAVTIQRALGGRVSAATRHLVWTLAIAGVLLLPPLTLSPPDWSPVEYAEPAGRLPVLGAGSLEPPTLDVPGSIPRMRSGLQWRTILTTVASTPGIFWSWPTRWATGRRPRWR